jgi:hypothetical protein
VFSFFQQDNIVASDKKMLTFCPILVGDYLLIPVERFDQKNLLLDSAKHLKYIGMFKETGYFNKCFFSYPYRKTKEKRSQLFLLGE